MGVLNDEPVQDPRASGEGAKFVALYDAMDADDQAMIRRWFESGVPVQQIWRRLLPHFQLGRSTVERGMRILRSRWES